MGGPFSSSKGGGRSWVFKWIRVLLRHERKLILDAMELAIERIELVEAVDLVDCTEKRLGFDGIVNSRGWKE